MILVTGGAGYIGSHTCLQLLQAGHDLVVLDNLSNSQPEALQRVQQLTGRQLQLVEGDIRDETMLDAVFRYPVKAVIHFAGLKPPSTCSLPTFHRATSLRRRTWHLRLPPPQEWWASSAGRSPDGRRRLLLTQHCGRMH